MISYGEAEECFIRQLFGENIRRRDNFRNVTLNGRINLAWIDMGQDRVIDDGPCETDNGRNFYQGDKNINKDYLTIVKKTLFLIK